MTIAYRTTKIYIDILEAIDDIRVHWDDGKFEEMQKADVKVYLMLAEHSLDLNQFQIRTLTNYLERTEKRVGITATLEVCLNPVYAA